MCFPTKKHVCCTRRIKCIENPCENHETHVLNIFYVCYSRAFFFYIIKIDIGKICVRLN